MVIKECTYYTILEYDYDVTCSIARAWQLPRQPYWCTMKSIEAVHQNGLSLHGKKMHANTLLEGLNNYPARACVSKGLCDRSWCLFVYLYIYIWTFFGTNLLSPKIHHFQRSILTQIGFSSNLMASGTA